MYDRKDNFLIMWLLLKNINILKKLLIQFVNMNEVLDTETTGLSFDGHKIVEIACIETKDLIPTGRIFHKLINPKEVCLKKLLRFMVFQNNF